jgi:outer membrane protein TolC
MSVGAGVERKFWKTGGKFSLSWSSGFINQNSPDIIIPGIVTIPSAPGTFYQHGVFATYTHPLLKNNEGKLDRLSYDLAAFNISGSTIRSVENQEEFLFTVGTAFLEWVLLHEQIQIALERLGLATEQLGETERRRASNLVDKVDVLRAGDAVRISKQNIMLLESRFRAKRAELATMSRSDVMYTQTPEYDLYQLETLPGLDTVIADLKNRSRRRLMLETVQNQLALQRDGLTESRRPSLDLKLAAGLQEGDEKPLGSLVLQKPDFLVGLQFSYPIGNRTVVADIEKADLQLRQIDDEIHVVELELEAAVRNIWIQLKDMEEVMQLNREQIASAQEKTGEEFSLYKQGRSQLAFVIQSRDNEENSKLIYAQNASLYKILRLRYHAIMDELIVGP